MHGSFLSTAYGRGSLLIVLLLFLSGCDFFGTSKNGFDLSCSIPEEEILEGCSGKDCIPALTDPGLISVSEATFMRNDDRIIGMNVGGEWIGVPHNILWWHEVINFNQGNDQVALTYCPLTGSGIAFDRANVGGATLGVSGLLFETNLVMYDRDSESLFPQMRRSGACGDHDGLQLEERALLEMNWAGWKTLYPDSRVVSNQTGYSRNYQLFPYDTYEDLNDDSVYFPISNRDTRRAIKERVLGIPNGDGGIAFPFGALDEAGPFNVVNTNVGGQDMVVFWDRAKEAATVYYARSGSTNLSFQLEGTRMVDQQTGSAWRMDGTAVDGAMAGTQLDLVEDAYVAFWFAWAIFQPNTELWTTE